MKAMRVRIVRLWKWFIGCSLLLVWFSVFFGFAFMDTYQDSFIYLGGRHGYNVANWLTSQVGQPGVWLILLVTAICFLIYVSARTVIWLRKLFTLSFIKRTKRKRQKKINRLLPINSRNRNLSIQNLMKWNSLWTGLSSRYLLRKRQR